MKKRVLGKTGIAVSELAFGGVEIGLPYGIGVNNVHDMIAEPDAICLLHAANDAGINFFDTARLYGQSEAIMGKAFRNMRDKVVIATKCNHFRDAEGNIPSYISLKKIIEHSLQESLEALQTSYVDVFMLHQGDREILENEDVSRIFSALKQSGIIRGTGVSTYNTGETELAITSGNWDLVQLPFNLLNQEQGIFFKDAFDRGIAIVIRSVLSKGLLSDRGKNLHPALNKVESHIKQYYDLTGESCPDLPALAAKFALSFPEVSSILIGIDRLESLEKSLAAADGRYLDETTIARAKKMAYPDPEFLNLAHWNKMGWLL
jgi:1-deoxyxylulose-5-phosphate synthase